MPEHEAREEQYFSKKERLQEIEEEYVLDRSFNLNDRSIIWRLIEWLNEKGYLNA